jgi:hypothetical protein
MKISIGLRANPNQVCFSVVREQEEMNEIFLVDKIIVPKSLDIPEQLKFIRSTLRDIINENNVSLACIRIAESNVKHVNIPRIYLEGVIQELIASSTVTKYYVGQISNISAKLGIERAEFKPFAEGRNDFMDMNIWSEISLEERESIMAAISALNL